MPSDMQTKSASATATMIDRDAHDWYKDAIIYQLHIKAFQDSNNDGIGDFPGLIERLDYVAELGITAIWLLPFYPSPLRDDGYDIAEYTSINPSYGYMEDFERLIDEAHKRGLRVITELVINHTSDQHPWFQRARKALPGSIERDFYVWSDTDDKWPETRIIFLDSENSNWSWDEEAGAYYWHRFYAHQPDLNFDNPVVLEEVLKVMRFWFDLGVDGLRLDAIPYLVERDGTNNENLPETHDILKKIRADLDARYHGKMLLAEANQWPEDTRPYFGDGDECHMGFHFPLMPRMYMALAQEDRHPITDIIRQTPGLPDGCQWAIFLRNHDELTLEMVTDEERDYMWSFYASDRRARINLGIRRRLAPLLENDRRKVELLNGLLFSMPGTPIVYYGDEIGMGDNYYLGDRDGVRTPMQWSADRNAGFSRANPQQLYLPIIQDPVYGFMSLNVEAQASTNSSLLNWMKRMIRIRKRQQAFGRGQLDFLYPLNRKILAFTRAYDEELLLCVFNVSRHAQAVELDLASHRGRVPVELEGGTIFPPIGDLPYMLTLPPYGFYWFLLAPEETFPDWHNPIQEVLPEFITLACRDTSYAGVLTPENLDRLAREVLSNFLPLQRWYGAKGEDIKAIQVIPGPSLAGRLNVSLLDVDTAESGRQRYFMPFDILWGEEHVAFGAPTLGQTVAKVRRTNRIGALIDASRSSSVAEALVAAMKASADQEANGLRLRASGTAGLQQLQDGVDEARALGVEQSNVSVAFGDNAMLKIYRRLQQGVQPDIEVGRFLTETAAFPNTPAYLGQVSLTDTEGETATIAACFAFVPNQGDGWKTVLEGLARDLEDIALTGALEHDSIGGPSDPTAEAHSPGRAEGGQSHGTAGDESALPYPLTLMRLLGQRTGELHRALCAPCENPDFEIEPLTQKDILEWHADTRGQADEAFARMARVPEDVRNDDVTALLARQTEAYAQIDQFAKMIPKGAKSRIHGDYHLGQVLVSQGDFYVIDFEGEPRRTLSERRAKSTPLRDVAGMLRSFDYAAYAAIDQLRSRGELTPPAEGYALSWRDQAESLFLEAYDTATDNLATVPDNANSILRLMMLQKSFYEICYEASNRPAWISIPVRGVLSLLDREP